MSRATRVLGVLPANPARAPTLTELAERVQVRRSSLLAILNALVDAGLPARHPRHRTYALGAGGRRGGDRGHGRAPGRHDAEVVDAWVRRAASPAAPAVDWAEVLAAIRARGYGITADPEPRRRLGEVLDERSVHGVTASDAEIAGAELGAEEYQVATLGRRGLRVNAIAAPVVDADGEVALAIAAFGWSEPLRERDRSPRGTGGGVGPGRHPGGPRA